MSAIAGVAGGAAIGGGIAIVVLAPLNAANNYIGSYYFGYGMIGGERDMYQEDWPKIKARLDKGELFATIWEEYVTKNTSGVMKNAGQIVIQVKNEWFQIVRDYFGSIPQDILDYIKIETSSFIQQGVTDVTGSKEAGSVAESFWQFAFAEESEEETTSGPIGPQQTPKQFTQQEIILQQKLLKMSEKQFDSEYKAMLRSSAPLWIARVFENVKKIRNAKKPKKLTAKEINAKINADLKSRAPNTSNQIALHWEKIQNGIRTKQSKSTILRNMKIYNSLVQKSGKRNLTIDTAVFWNTGKITKRYK